ncbi:MAG: hypothetical protein CL912_09710 [Deltaproteobacteria bacterium]|nr:hypothetical protein [Deltaproteobacteria bacterium]
MYLYQTTALELSYVRFFGKKLVEVTMRKTIRRSVLLFAFAVDTVRAVNNGLARTPPLGWNNWNSLGCDVSAELLLDTASRLVSLGLMVRQDILETYLVVHSNH